MNAICHVPHCKTQCFGIPERLRQSGWLIEGTEVKCPEHSGKVWAAYKGEVTIKAETAYQLIADGVIRPKDIKSVENIEKKEVKNPGLISSWMDVDKA
jgi:hypothetical protein